MFGRHERVVQLDDDGLRAGIADRNVYRCGKVGFGNEEVGLGNEEVGGNEEINLGSEEIVGGGSKEVEVGNKG